MPIAAFLENERNLGRVIRFSAKPRVKDESVAEHSFHVAFYSMLLADMEIQAGRKVDIETLLRATLLHDLEECLTGDIIHTFKYSDKRVSTEIKRMSAEFYRQLTNDLPAHMQKKYDSLWDNAKAPNIEGKILKAADRLEALMYSIQEYNLGNQAFKPMIEEIKQKILEVGLESANSLLKELEK